MPVSHSITTALNPTLSLTTAKRLNQSLASWASDAVSAALNGGSSTAPASGSGSPLQHTVVWSKNSREYTTLIEHWGSAEELAELVAAFKAEIAAQGGTIVSG